jgi:hypothetical protein
MAASVTLSANSLEGQIFEACRKLQELEFAVPEETRPNNITLAPDLEAGQISITITLPITLSGSGGSMTLSAGTYL